MIFDSEYTLIAGLIFFLISVFMASYGFVRFIKRIKYISIPIDRIQPYFSYGSPMKTTHLECSFLVRNRKNTSYISELIALTYFLGSDDGFIIFDIGIDLPVLYTSGEKIVGEEAIEHFLLQKKSALTIKFVSGNYSPGTYTSSPIAMRGIFEIIVFSLIA